MDIFLSIINKLYFESLLIFKKNLKKSKVTKRKQSKKVKAITIIPLLPTRSHGI